MNRLSPLINSILAQSKLDHTSPSFFQETKKLAFVRIIMGWRLGKIVSNLFEQYLPCIHNPYQHVRQYLGSILSTTVQLEWTPFISCVDEVLQSSLLNSSGGYSLVKGTDVGDVPLTLNEKRDSMMKDLLVRMGKLREEGLLVEIGPTDYANAGKTCNLYHLIIRSYLIPSTFMVLYFFKK